MVKIYEKKLAFQADHSEQTDFDEGVSLNLQNQNEEASDNVSFFTLKYDFRQLFSYLQFLFSI